MPVGTRVGHQVFLGQESHLGFALGGGFPFQESAAATEQGGELQQKFPTAASVLEADCRCFQPLFPSCLGLLGSVQTVSDTAWDLSVAVRRELRVGKKALSPS